MPLGLPNSVPSGLSVLLVEPVPQTIKSGRGSLPRGNQLGLRKLCSPKTGDIEFTGDIVPTPST